MENRQIGQEKEGYEFKQFFGDFKDEISSGFREAEDTKIKNLIAKEDMFEIIKHMWFHGMLKEGWRYDDETYDKLRFLFQKYNLPDFNEEEKRNYKTRQFSLQRFVDLILEKQDQDIESLIEKEDMVGIIKHLEKTGKQTKGWDNYKRTDSAKIFDLLTKHKIPKPTKEEMKNYKHSNFSLQRILNSIGA